MIESLGILSFIAFAAALVVVVVTFHDRPSHGGLVVLALVGSSAMYQSTSAFGEGLTAALVVIAVCAGVRRLPAAVFIFVLAASLGKETLAPFVVALVLICARSHGDGLLPARRLMFAAISAGASATIVNALFNVFRFGGVGNLLYLDPALRTPGTGRKLEFLSAIFASRPLASCGFGHSSRHWRLLGARSESTACSLARASPAGTCRCSPSRP